MFRLITSIFLLIAFAIQAFHQGGIVVNYYMNSGGYAKNCENKAKPVLKCNGKCQMAKKILEAQKKADQIPDRKFENKIQLLCFNSDFVSLPFHNSTFSNRYNVYLVIPEPSVHVASIFHPPCVV